ncbi:MAG TPA: cyclase family protein [Longimicrobiales bacterium]|nr:cyclase family protein [Longimicrobiales bacterium]
MSQPVGTGTAVWPGDQPYRLNWTLQRDRGDSVNVAAITLSAHTGTHVDAGYHVESGGPRAADLPLELFIGPATVVDARQLDPLDERVLDLFDAARAERVLFRTRGAVDEKQFPRTFRVPTRTLAQRLVDAGIRLVGTDAPSMDAFDSKTLDTHRVLVTGGVAILENLMLEAVPPGQYTLIAFPLRLTEADGSPVRAVLLEGFLNG